MFQQELDSAKQNLLAGRWSEAESAARRALVIQPDSAQAMHFAGIAAYRAGRPADAIDWIQRAIRANPRDPEFLCNLGTIFGELSRWHDAADAFRRAVALYPAYPMAWHGLGRALGAARDLPAAVEALEKAAYHDPKNFEIQLELGIALSDLRRMTDAVAVFRKATIIAPDRVEGHNNLANALVQIQQCEQAIPVIQQALKLRPDLAQSHAVLGSALHGAGRIDEAIAAYLEALRLSPGLVDAASNLAGILRDIGRLEEAAQAERHALSIQPDHRAANSNRLYLLYFQQTYDSKSILEEHLRWNRQFAQPLQRQAAGHDNDRSENRRLRIGYVSPDFFQHCQSFFTIPLLSRHDHAQFEIYCYSSVIKEDELTPRLRKYADVWRTVTGWTDEQLAQQIRRDRIDILIDLTMHMSDGRPLLFARKPAPVQICWLAYPGTTGLTAMDYRLTDPYLDPPGQHDDWYSEKSIRLPETFWCFNPLTRELPVNSLPASNTGTITFGCLNSSRKVTDRTLKLWSSVLSAVPNSRLLLLSPQGSHRQAVQEKLNIPSHRLDFVEYQPRDAYLRQYHRIDIGLDTLPYNGHTTSLDSYWMGVPVVTRIGETVVGRAGWSQLNNLNLTELAAETDDRFIQIAKDLAADLPRLTDLRATLRPRMEKSPLMDPQRFAKNMESTYRDLWRIWCRAQSPVPGLK